MWCATKKKPGKDLNVQIAMWGCVLTPASGCFTLNHKSETKTSQGKAHYTLLLKLQLG
jgi:hypothetical protein